MLATISTNAQVVEELYRDVDETWEAKAEIGTFYNGDTHKFDLQGLVGFGRNFIGDFYLGAATGIYASVIESTNYIPVMAEFTGDIPISTNLFPFITVRAGYAFKMGGEDYAKNYWTFNPQFGLCYRFSPKFNFRGSLGYLGLYNNASVYSTINCFQVKVGIGINF